MQSEYYEYLVVTKGMSLLNSLEDFGNSLESALNQEGNAHRELGWELWQVQILNNSDWGNGGFVYVYRRPKP